jgi:hypothetical protein
VSTLDRVADWRTTDGFAAAGADAGQADEAGVYLTDEVFLYRVVGLLASGANEIVKVEDCYWLDVVRVPVRELRARRLRVVTPAPARV